MPERAYSVAEIDRMRQVIEHRWLFGSSLYDMRPGVGVSSRSYDETEKTKCVEEILRTYMLAGVEPDTVE